MGQYLARARELCGQLGETPEVLPVLSILIIFHGLRAEHAIAREIETQVLALTEHMADPSLATVARYMLGFSMTARGEFVQALTYSDDMIRIYDPQRHHALTYTYGNDPGVAALSWASWDLWFLGYPAQAMKRSDAAIELAQTQDHAFGLAFAQSLTGVCLHQICRDYAAVKKWTELFSTLSTEQGFALFQAAVPMFLAWTRMNEGQVDEVVLTQFRQGMDGWRALSSELHRPMQLTYLAQAHAQIGQIPQGLALLDEALAFVEKTEERYFEAEVHRVKGELLRTSGVEAEAEACFHQAIAVARAQSAKSWELRATVSLARLWQEQGKSADAKATLAAIYGWFGEGFDLPDLKDAKNLLDQLA